MSPARQELYSHDADMGVRVRGDTLAAALEQAAVALVTDPSEVRAERAASICCSAGPGAAAV